MAFIVSLLNGWYLNWMNDHSVATSYALKRWSPYTWKLMIYKSLTSKLNLTMMSSCIALLTRFVIALALTGLSL